MLSRHGPVVASTTVAAPVTVIPLSDKDTQACEPIAVHSATGRIMSHSGQQPHSNRTDGDSADGESDVFDESKPTQCCICGSKDGVFYTKFYPEGICGACGRKCMICGSATSRNDASSFCYVCAKRRGALLTEDSFVSLSSNGDDRREKMPNGDPDPFGTATTLEDTRSFFHRGPVT